MSRAPAAQTSETLQTFECEGRASPGFNEQKGRGRLDGYARPGALHLEHPSMKPSLLHTALAVLVGFPLSTAAQDAQRHAEVATRGADVMPFSLKATTHRTSKERA
jgi:hypothetical protein